MNRLDDLKAAQEKRTPGPWESDDGCISGGGPQALHDVAEYVLDDQGSADAAFIALASNLTPDLLAVVEAAENLLAGPHDEQWCAFNAQEVNSSKLIALYSALARLRELA